MAFRSAATEAYYARRTASGCDFCGVPAARAEAGRSPLLARNEPITFSARWWREQVWRRPVARRVLCAALGAALCVRSGVPGAVLFARFAAPDGALSQTSARLRAATLARWVSWWLGLPPLTPSELLTKRPLQMQPCIQEKRERCADRPAWPLNLDPFSCSGFLPRSMSLDVESRVIDLDQLGCAVQATLEFPLTGLILSAGAG